MIEARTAREAASPNDHARLAAAEALGGAGPEAVPLLRTLVDDPNDFVRQAAKASVFAVARAHADPGAARLGLAAARDPNLHIRGTVWRGLKALPRDLIARAYEPPDPVPGHEPDCLDRCLVPTAGGPLRDPATGGRLRCGVCVALVATPGFERYLDLCLRSLTKNGGLEGLDCALVAFVPGADDACRAVCRRHGALCVEPVPLVPPHASMKGMAYSLPRWVDARCYVSLEPDMLVLGPIRDIVEAALADREGRLFAVPNLPWVRAREAAMREGAPWPPDLQGWIDGHCAGDGDDLRFLLGTPAGTDPATGGGLVPDPPALCNAGLFLGSAEAFGRVEAQIRAMRPFAALWIDAGIVHWRDEMVWNLAYGRAGNLCPLPKAYNYEPRGELDGLRYDWGAGRYVPSLPPAEARVFHFVGGTKAWMPLYMQAHGIPMPGEADSG